MRRSFASQAASLLIVALATGGCGGDNNADQSNMVTDGRPVEGSAPGGGPSGPGGGGLESNVDPSSIRAVMIKIGRGPNALTTVLGNELKAESPAWDTIVPQTSEYAKLAGQISKNDPPKGSDESWAKLTAAFAESATALDKAAQAKDRAAALTAHGSLASSCMGCHREHRAMGPPGKGMRPGFGGPGGGPPPGGPGAGGPPPGGPGAGGPPAGGAPSAAPAQK